MTDLEAGSLFGRYRIERRLGGGGFGDVYLAIDTNPQLPRRVAVKILKRELAQDQNFRDRFIRESQLAIEVDHHPNIVPVYDAGEEGGTLFIAMRFVPGHDLQEVLGTEGRLSVERTVAIISGIASALDVAHSVGIVHRDVKPANILINEETDQAYLADLGLTKRVDAQSSLTMTGMFMGTLSYASPEQLDNQNVDARSDVYSLGCVLFECLTGRPPFVGGLDAVIAAHIRTDPPKVTAFRPEVGPAIDAVVARAMAKEPRDRFPTAGQLGTATVRALSRDGQTVIEAIPPAPVPPPSPPPVPMPPPYAPTPSGSSHPPPQPTYPPPYPSGPSGPSYPPPGPSGPPTGPPHGPQRSKKPVVIGAIVAAVVVLLVAIGAAVALSSGGEGGQTKRTTTTTTTEGTDTSLSPDERALLTHVPADIRDSCSSSDASSPAITELSCTSSDGETFLLYTEFANADDLGDAYDTQRTGIGIDSGDPSAAQCPGEGPRESPDRIVCEDRDGAKWLHWTDTNLLVMVAASPFENAMTWETLIDQLPSFGPE